MYICETIVTRFERSNGLDTARYIKRTFFTLVLREACAEESDRNQNNKVLGFAPTTVHTHGLQYGADIDVSEIIVILVMFVVMYTPNSPYLG